MTHQYCSFKLDGLLFGVRVEMVQEVLRYQEMTRVPLAPAVVAGLINLRGQIVPAIDLRRRLQMPERPEGSPPMNVVVRGSEGGLSFLVDEIGEVLQLDESSFEPPPETLLGVARDLIRGAYKLPGQLLLAIDAEAVVNLTAADRK